MILVVTDPVAVIVDLLQVVVVAEVIIKERILWE
jgi:hypothetical protein